MKNLILTVIVIGVIAICTGGLCTAADSGGTISGTIKYGGTAPEPKKVDITKDKEVCGLKPHFDKELMVGSDGGVANVVVYIADAKGENKPETVTFDQKGCEYQPHVLAFPAGSTVQIINSDGILHNIHTYSTKNPSINIAQPKFKKKVEVKVEQPETIKVSCDAHGWMHGWWFSSANPYFAVTDDKGSFTIKNVPAGDYTVTVWQEKLGEQTEKVSVKDGQTATLSVTLKPKA